MVGYSLDVEEDVGLLVEDRPEVTDRHGGVVHLEPLAVARLGNTAAEEAVNITESPRLLTFHLKC